MRQTSLTSPCSRGVARDFPRHTADIGGYYQDKLPQEPSGFPKAPELFKNMTHLSQFLFLNRREDSQEGRRVSLPRGRTVPNSKGSSGNVRKTRLAPERTLVNTGVRIAAWFTVLFVLYVVLYFIIQGTLSTHLHI